MLYSTNHSVYVRSIVLFLDKVLLNFSTVFAVYILMCVLRTSFHPTHSTAHAMEPETRIKGKMGASSQLL